MDINLNTNDQNYLLYDQLGNINNPSIDPIQNIAPLSLEEANINISRELSVETVFSSQISELRAGLDEANRGIEFAQNARNDLQNTNETLNQMRELAQRASSEDLTTQEREDINTQFQEMIGAIEPNPSYSSDDEITFEVSSARPVDFTMQEVDTETLGLSGLEITSTNAALEAMDQINNATTRVNSYEQDLGNLEQNLQEVAIPLADVQEQINTTNSAIQQQTDFASESVNFDKQSIMSQLGSLTIAQSNASPMNVFKLLS